MTAKVYKKKHTNKNALLSHLGKIKKRGGVYKVKDGKISYSFPEGAKKQLEMF